MGRYNWFDDKADALRGGDATGALELTGPTSDVLAVWTIDGGGVPIDADAGGYQLGSDEFTFATINVGDDQAAVQATWDAGIFAVFGGALGLGSDLSTTVTGDWSSFTVECSARIIALGLYVNSNTLTLAAAPVSDPTLTATIPGHGTYVDIPGPYGDVLGRATLESPFGDQLLMDPQSEHWSDGAFVSWHWFRPSNGGRGVRDLLGGTYDLMDVQRLALETPSYRQTGFNTQAYSDHDLAVRCIMATRIDRNGATRSAKARLETDDLAGSWQVELTETAVTETIQAHAGQTAPLIDAKDSTGAPVFQVDPLGPILYSPNGSGHRLVVANDGTLSTAPL